MQCLVPNSIELPESLGPEVIWEHDLRYHDACAHRRDDPDSPRFNRQIGGSRLTRIPHVGDLLVSAARPSNSIKACEALPPTRRYELVKALTKLLDEENVAGDGTLTIPGEYLEVVVEMQE